MATLRVRYRNGETDEWEVHERLDGLDLMRALWEALANRGISSFAVASEVGAGTSDYGRVALAMSDVAMWHLDGQVDFQSDAALWAELENPPD